MQAVSMIIYPLLNFLYTAILFKIVGVSMLGCLVQLDFRAKMDFIC